MKRSYLPLILAFIFIDETCNNFILNLFAKQSSVTEIFLYSGFLLTSILSAPIQSGYSDYYCRKISLVVSLSFSLLSILFAFLSTETAFSPLLFLILAFISKGALGNTLPLSWAAIADTQGNNFRFSFALSTSAMAFGYLILIGIKSFFNNSQSIFIIFALLATLIYLSIRFFYDIRDKQFKNQINSHGFVENLFIEINLIINHFLKDRRTRKAISAFMLWEISFYTALISDVDVKISDFKYVSLSMLIGYFAGVALLKFFYRYTDYVMIKAGYILSIVSLIPIFIAGPFTGIGRISVVCYFFYSLAAAFLAPSLFSILSKERRPHEQGKIYGLIDSSDTISFLIASIFVIFYHTYQVNAIFLPLFSLIVFLLSSIPYGRFKKTPAVEY